MHCEYQLRLRNVFALRTEVKRRGNSRWRRLMLNLRARYLMLRVTRRADQLLAQRDYKFAELFYRLCYNLQALLGHGATMWIWLRIGACRKAAARVKA